MTKSRRKKLDAALLVIISGLFRLAWAGYGMSVVNKDVEKYLLTAGDASEYLTLARNLASHQVFSIGKTVDALTPTAFRPPLYPALISIFWWDSKAPIAELFLAQAMLGVATVVLVYLIAFDAFGRRIALIAGLGFALAPMSSFYVSRIMTETLFTFLLSLGIFFWGRCRHVLTGICFGFAFLTRPTIFPFLLLLIFLATFQVGKAYRQAFIKISMVALIVCLPWVIRNAIVFGRFIPVASSGSGINLLFGTIEVNFGAGNIWATVLNHPATKIDGQYTETDVDRIYRQKAIDRIKQAPLSWVIVRAKQYPRLFMDHGEYLYSSSWPIARLIKVLFLFGNLCLLLLAVYALYVLKQRAMTLPHITLFPVYLALVHLPMWVESRYSLPAMPMMTILASVGIEHIYSKWQSSPRRVF